MMNSLLKKSNSVFTKAELIFKILYLLLVLLSFTNLFAKHAALTALNYFLVAFGAVLLINRGLRLKRYIKSYACVFLILFCVSLLISAFLNREYGILESIQSFAWTTLQFGLLYMTDSDRSPADLKREFNVLAGVFVGYIFLANLIGIGMFLANYGTFGPFSFNGNIIGFVWGRLWGVYSDPNNGSAMTSLAVVFSLGILCSPLRKKRWLSAGMIINIILSYGYIMLSDSRTGMVCIIAGVAVFLFMRFYTHSFAGKLQKPALRAIVSMILAVAVSVACFESMQLVKKGYNFAIEKIIEQQGDAAGEEDADTPALITGRDQADTETDISNRRFSLWESGIEIWKTSPIFGVSQRYIKQYALDKLPDTYMVNNDSGEFDSTHNMFLDVLVGQGVVGLGILLAFFGSVAWLLIKRFLRDKQNIKSVYYITLFSGLVVLSCSCMFVLDVLYLNSASTFMFWSMLGLFTRLLRVSPQSSASE